jgi:hypothetical protein
MLAESIAIRQLYLQNPTCYTFAVIVWSSGAVDDLAQRGLLTCPIIAWGGEVWRVHGRRFAATDAGGSLIVSGRYHRGRDSFPNDEVFAALYTSAGADVATWEMIRHSKSTSGLSMWQRFVERDLSKLHMTLQAVLDIRNPSPAGLSLDALTGEDYALPQAIAAAAHADGLEGLLVPTATAVGEIGADFNVVIFTTSLRPGSEIRFLEKRTPNLPP